MSLVVPMPAGKGCSKQAIRARLEKSPPVSCYERPLSTTSSFNHTAHL